MMTFYGDYNITRFLHNVKIFLKDIQYWANFSFSKSYTSFLKFFDPSLQLMSSNPSGNRVQTFFWPKIIPHEKKFLVHIENSRSNSL